jgi:hypothetical protein
MKKVLFVSMVLLVFSAISNATVIFYDDFEDGVLNTSIWTNNSGGSGIVSESGGQLKLQANGGYYSNRGGVVSKSAATLQAGQKVVWSSTFMESMEWAAENYWGLCDAPTNWGNNVIRLGTPDAAGRQLRIDMRKNGGPQQTLVIWQYPQYIENGWTLEWSENRVVVTSAVWGVIFDSADPAKNGGISWNIPDVGKSMYFFAEAQLHSNWITFNDMKLEVIPEPATIVMLGLSSLGLFARKR